MKRFCSTILSRQPAITLVGAFPSVSFILSPTHKPQQFSHVHQIRLISSSPISAAGNDIIGGGDVQDTEETHPDFQPRLVSTEIAQDEIQMVKKDIDDTIKSEEVVIFIKGVPEAPMCAFSKRMIDMMEILGLEYTSFDVLAHPVVRTYVKEVSAWPTIPQLFLKGEFVGGLDVVQKMIEAGDLQKIMDEKGISYRKS